MNPDRLAALEEEQRFLFRSLADLDREYEAGDVDDVDYHELRDGYTVRAAATMRSIDQGRSELPAPLAANWRRRLIGGGVIVALIAVVWWALAASSAQRLPGQVATGLDPRTQREVLLAEARVLQLKEPAAAAEIYANVLAQDPDDVEALTYRGWTLALASTSEPDIDVVARQLDQAVESLVLAIETDPTYPDPFCFLGIVQFRFIGDADAALPLVDGCLASNPPADVRGLVESLRADVAAAAGTSEE